MKVKDLIKLLQEYNPDSTIELIQEENLECEDEWWDNDKCIPAGKATEIYSWDLYSHGFYLLAIND